MNTPSENPPKQALRSDSEKEKSNPLNLCLLGIGIALVLTLASNGYRTLIGNQMERMKETRETHSEEAKQLSSTDTNLAATLSTMCEQTLLYRALASQLRVLLPFEQPPSGGGDPVNERPGVCNAIAQLKSESPGETGRVDTQTVENGRIIDAALNKESAASEDRALRLEAEL